MPTNVTKDTIHKFVYELVKCREEYGRMKTVRKDSPLAKLQISTGGVTTSRQRCRTLTA